MLLAIFLVYLSCLYELSVFYNSRVSRLLNITNGGFCVTCSQSLYLIGTYQWALNFSINFVLKCIVYVTKDKCFVIHTWLYSSDHVFLPSILKEMVVALLMYSWLKRTNREKRHNFVISFQTMQYFDHLRNSCDAWKICLTDFSERADR